MNILIIEDDAAIRQELKLLLENALYQVTVLTEFHHVVEDILQMEPDLILLDVNLPQQSGFEICKSVRKTSDVPIIFLTSRTDSMDELSGMLQGGDDYITKPFSLAVLRARVNTQLRNRTAQMQKESAKNTQIWEGSYWKFDFTNMRFTVSGQEVELSKTEQKLLALLVQHAGMTVPRETLMDRIWTDGAVYVDEIALSVAIKRLRDKLQAKEQIRTVYGIGYVWEV